jgi:hypothetical protein
MNEQSPWIASDLQGSHDGHGAGDQDQVFAGYRAYVFNTRQLARLLQMRGEVLEARLGLGRWASEVAPCRP